MEISFIDKIVNTQSISIIFLSQYNDLRRNEVNVENLLIRIGEKVEVIDEVLYSYIYLFNLEFPNINLEFIFNNSNEKLKGIAQNKLKLLPKCKFSSPLLNSKKDIFEEKSISPIIKVSNECLEKLFKSNNLLEQTTQIIKADTNFKKYLNSKSDFFNYFKSIKKESLVWLYYLAILDDLSILRIFYFGEQEKIDFKVENYSINDSEKIVKDIYFTLKDNGFFQFNELQIYFFRLFIDKIKPKENEFRDDRQNKKIKAFCTRLFNLISYIKSINTGIKELATNIVEHSGDVFGEGFGVISARVFAKESFIRNKKIDNILFEPWIETSFDDDYFLDLNIIDCGKIDLRESYIKKVKDFDDVDLSEDIERLTNEELWMLFDYQNIQMIHQTKRYNASLGLLIFSNLILSKNGFIKFTTNNLKNDVCESFCLYHRNTIVPSLNTNELNKIGTSYNFIIPFNSFRKNDIVESNNTNQSFKNSNESYINSNELFNYKFYSDIKNCEKDENGLFLVKVCLPAKIFPDKYKKVRYLSEYLERHFVHNMIPIIYSGDSFFKSNFESSSDWFRFLSDYNYIRKKPLIVIGDEDFYQKKYNEIIKINTCFEDSETDFWSNDSNLIFYINREYLKGDKKLNIWFNSVLSGNSFNQFIKLNSNVNNYQEFNLVVFEEFDVKLIEETHVFDVPDNFFYKNDRLLNFEVLIDSNKKDKLFLETVNSLLNLDISSWESEKLNKDDQFFQTISGYKISDSHFKLGSKIHIKDFYYAKPMFYNSFYTNSFAFIIASFIKENHLHKIPHDEIVTLIGYENYSEILVSQIRKIINDFERSDRIKHDTYIERNETPAVSKTVKNINGNIILIVPISSTFSTQNKIKEDLVFIHQNSNPKLKEINLKFLEPDLTCLVVIPDDFEEKLKNSFNVTKNDNPLGKTHLEVFNITSSKKSNFCTSNNSEQKTFIKLYTDWHLVYKCNLCIPDEKQIDEKCLIFTESNNVTPDLIFDLPVSKPTYFNNDKIFSLLFNKDYVLTGLNSDIDVESNFFNVIASPLKRRSFNYQFYIKSSSLIHRSNESKSNIKIWLKDLKENFFNESEKYIILKQSVISNSGFVDLVNDFVFDGKATILQFSPKDDNIQNFVKFHKDLLLKSTLIYVDDILAYGKSFSLINNYIKNINPDLKLKYFITLSNKLNYFDEENLISQLPNKENLLCFSRINLPTLINYSDDEFFIKRNSLYINLKKNSLLDLSKIFFKEKLEKNNPKDLEFDPQEPISKPKDLLKALLFHEIFCVFEFENGNYKNDKIIDSILQGNIEAFNMFFKKIFLSRSIQEFKKNFPFYQDLDLKLNVYKILSEPPFRGHKHLKELVFNEVLRKLINFKFENSKELFDFKENSLFNEYQRLKLLLRIAVNLNINYIYSVDFLIKINSLIKKLEANEIVRKKIEFKVEKKSKEFIGTWSIVNDDDKNKFNVFGFRTYFTCLIQELIFEDDAKSSVLIKNIWKIVNKKEISKNYEIQLKNIKGKPSNDFICNYIDLLRILILENNFVFERFYNNFLKKNLEKDIFKIDKLNEAKEDSIKNYFNKYRNEALELMLYNYNDNDIDKNLKNLFVKTVALKTALNYDYNDKIQNTISLKAKSEIILKELCEILGVKEGGAYLTVQYKNRNINTEIIKSNDLYTVAQVQNSDDFIIEQVLEDENSIVLDLFKGINDNEAKKPKTTFELYFNEENIWDHKNIQHSFETGKINYDSKRRMECEFIFRSNKKYKNLFFLRLTKIEKDSNNNFESRAIAVITFYSSDLGKHFDPKNIRFLLLLRNELTKFITNELDNDSLADYIAEQRGARVRMILNHGIEVFDKTFDFNMNKLIEETSIDPGRKEIQYIDTSKQYLTNKLNLISRINDEKDKISNFSINSILLEYKYYSKNVLMFYHVENKRIENENFICFTYDIKEEILALKFDFPESFIKEMLFELVYNIRKHVVYREKSNINEENKLMLNLKIDYNHKFKELIIELKNNFFNSNQITENIKLDYNKNGTNLINILMKKMNNDNKISIEKNNNEYKIILKFYGNKN